MKFIKNEKGISGLPENEGKFFALRGFETKEQVENFLHFDETQLRKDYLDLDELCQAIIDHPKDELVTIYGDYDCDGITATAILMRSLSALGYRVNFHINNRLYHGFGMNEKGVCKLLRDAYERQMKKNEDENLALGEDWSEIPTLILTCDNGIASMPIIRELQEKGLNFLQDRQARGSKKVTYPVTKMKVLVTDHHEQVGIPLENLKLVHQDDEMYIRNADGELVEIPEDSTVANGYAIPAGYEIWKDWAITEGCALCCPTVDEWRLDEDASVREEICGAELARRVMMHLAKMLGKEDDTFFEDLMILSGIATVADCVNMASPANHWIVKQAIRMLNDKTPFFAIEEIKRQENITKVDEQTIGFTIGPLFNALSRIAGDPSDGVNMLIEMDERVVSSIVFDVRDINKTRKEESNMWARVTRQKVIEQFERYGEDPIIVVDSAADVGIAGIIASRLVEDFERPALVVNEGGKGSARSIPGINLIQVMMQQDDLWEKDKNGNPIRGGHAGAAGFSLPIENIGTLRERFRNSVQLPAKEDELVDIILPVSEWNNPVIKEWQAYAPFGQGFEAPRIVLQGMYRNVQYLPLASNLKSHVKFELRDYDGKISCAWWHNFCKWNELVRKMCQHDTDEISVLGTLTEDTYNKKAGYLFTVSKVIPEIDIQ